MVVFVSFFCCSFCNNEFLNFGCGCRSGEVLVIFCCCSCLKLFEGKFFLGFFVFFGVGDGLGVRVIGLDFGVLLSFGVVIIFFFCVFCIIFFIVFFFCNCVIIGVFCNLFFLVGFGGKGVFSGWMLLVLFFFLLFIVFWFLILFCWFLILFW